MANLLHSLERNWVLGLITLLAFITALSTGEVLFFRLTYLFGGILVISFIWAWLNVHWVRVQRQVRNHHVQVGHFFEEDIILKNTGPLGKLWLEVKDFSDLPNHRVSRVISRLGRRHQYSWHIRTPCYRRGRYRLGPVAVLSSDPFSIFLFKQNLPSTFTASVVVFPLAVDLPNFQPPHGELSGGEMIHRRTHYITTNVSGIREYTFGDSFKQIHWRSTARLGRPMVKEFELDPQADIWIFLDLERQIQVGPAYADLKAPLLPTVPWEKMPPFELAPSTEEYSVTIAASLSRHFLRQGRSVGLVAYPHGREVAQSDRGERQLTRIYEILAVVQAQGTMPLKDVLTTETTRLRRSTTALVITASPDPRWVGAVRHLKDRGIRSTAIVLDPASFGAKQTAKGVEAELINHHIPYYIVKEGDNLAVALSSKKL